MMIRDRSARGRPFVGPYVLPSANLLMTGLRVVAGPHDGRNLTRNQGSFRGCEIGEGLAALLARYNLGARYGYVSLRLQNEGNRVLAKSCAGYSGFRQLAGVEDDPGVKEPVLVQLPVVANVIGLYQCSAGKTDERGSWEHRVGVDTSAAQDANLEMAVVVRIDLGPAVGLV